MLDDYRILVTGLVRDDSGRIASGDVDQAVALAVTRYSTDRPREVVEDVLAPGGHFLDLPAGWIADASRLVGIETPPDQVPPRCLRSDAWSVYDMPEVSRIMLAQILAPDAPVRLRYTVPHQVAEAVDTIPEADREAVAHWAAGHLLGVLANAYAGDREATIQSDSVDHAAKSADYGRRSAACRKFYQDHLGLNDKRTVAAGSVVTLPERDSQGGARLVHGRRRWWG